MKPSSEGVKTSERENAKRGSTAMFRVKPGAVARISRLPESLELRLAPVELDFGPSRRTSDEQHEGMAASRGVAASGRGNPLKVQSPRVLPA
jgi:hypothetical protein